MLTRHHDSTGLTESDPLITNDSTNHTHKHSRSLSTESFGHLWMTNDLNNDSLHGPSTTRQQIIFWIVVFLATISGAGAELVGKICYQVLPGEFVGFDGFRDGIWIAWLLVTGGFAVCTIAIYVGWNEGTEWKRFIMTYRPSLLVFTMGMHFNTECNISVFVYFVFGSK